MKFDRRLALALAALAGVTAGGLALVAALLWSSLEPSAQALIASLMAERLPLVVLAWLVAFGLCAFALNALYQRYVVAPGRLLEQAQVLLGGAVARPLTAHGAAENQGLAQAINELVRQRALLRDDIASQVAQASQEVARERNRLAALMSELTQSVVVCNLDGRILLYNNQARAQFRALSETPALADGAELIGLGRSIYTVFDRKLVAHALETVQQRMQRGAANPSAQFVTSTRAGQLLRVQMTPVRDVLAQDAAPQDQDPSAAGIGGFVLMLDNITQAYEQQSSLDQLVHGLIEGNRAALANMQAAIEMLEFPDLEPAMRERFQAVVRDEASTMTQRLQTLAHDTAEGLKTRWPLEDMLGADLVAAARRRIETACKLRTGALEIDAALWLKVDSFSLMQALASLASRLESEYEVRLVQLRLSAAGGQRAHLDLVWSGQSMSTETVIGWEMDAMRIGAETLPLSVRDVVERHGAEFWFERERVRHQAFFRFLLPLAQPQQPLDAATFVHSESRPEYYDFDLFKTSEQAHELHDRLLTDLSYTVFDTETTGLAPSAGDEIIQIGAARIVNGKLLRHECFEQLVDPQRSIPAQSIPIHGIEPGMLVGQPTIGQVLPAFHAFAQDTVLVAHNAAFDMRFLELKQAQTGIRFDQPVLDTLLLSALVHPQQESHRLEAIAERLDVPVIGRHTALGDAMVTAEIFLKLIPVLQEKGIRTLGQAREASQKTYLARLRY